MPNILRQAGIQLPNGLGPGLTFTRKLRSACPTACTKLDELIKIATQNHTWTSSSNLDFEQLGLGNSKFWLTRTKPAHVQPNSAADIRALKCKQKES